MQFLSLLTDKTKALSAIKHYCAIRQPITEKPIPSSGHQRPGINLHWLSFSQREAVARGH